VHRCFVSPNDVVGLDSTSMMGPCPHPVSPPSTEAPAGEAGDDDVEEGDDAINNRHDGGTDGVDDCHDGISDGTEDGLHLEIQSVTPIVD
jgi:hypothetical protein